MGLSSIIVDRGLSVIAHGVLFLVLTSLSIVHHHFQTNPHPLLIHKILMPCVRHHAHINPQLIATSTIPASPPSTSTWAAVNLNKCLYSSNLDRGRHGGDETRRVGVEEGQRGVLRDGR